MRESPSASSYEVAIGEHVGGTAIYWEGEEQMRGPILLRAESVDLA
jgi:hypothetical protein